MLTMVELSMLQVVLSEIAAFYRYSVIIRYKFLKFFYLLVKKGIYFYLGNGIGPFETEITFRFWNGAM